MDFFECICKLYDVNEYFCNKNALLRNKILNCQGIWNMLMSNLMTRRVKPNTLDGLIPSSELKYI